MTFLPQATGNLEASLGAPCTRIQRTVEKLGFRKDKGFRDLEQATLGVEGVGARMQALIHLMARSRKVELDIMTTQFGPMLGPKINQMKRDLADFEKTLGED